MPFMRHVGDEVDLSGWDFGLDLPADAVDAVSATIQAELATEGGVYWTLPSLWDDSDGRGGPAPTDALTVYVSLSLDNGDENGPTFGASMSELIEDMIEALVFNGGEHAGKVDTDSAKTLTKVRDGLQALVARLDAVISEAVPVEADPPTPARAAGPAAP